MSRKTPSFNQLIAYMNLGASSRENNIYHNVFSRKAEEIETEFRDNLRYVPKRKNGVTLYHEVISITRSKQLDQEEQIEILRQVIYKYIQERAGNNLVYGVLHDDKADNLHYHLLISSNALESAKKHRLSKSQFDSVKRNLELYVLECHPELEQQKLISKDKQSLDTQNSKEKLSNKGAELKRRTGKTPQRELVKESLLNIFASATTRQEFIELMESEGFQLYKRGKHWGILNEHTNRKHRFATLGVLEEFEKLEFKLAQAHSADTHKQDSSGQTKDTQNTKDSKTTPDTKNKKSYTETTRASNHHQTQESKKDSASEEIIERQSQAKKIREKIRSKKAQKKSGFKKQR